MKAVSARTLTVVVSIFLTSFSVCIATKTPAKQIFTSFVSCQVSNAALDKAGISDKTLYDTNSNPMVATKVLSLLSDSNSAKLLANPKILTIDGESARIELSNIYKIDIVASIKKNSLIESKINWLDSDSNSPETGSVVKTHIQLHSGEPAVLSCQQLNGHTLFLIVTSEILVPNKPKPNSVATVQGSAIHSKDAAKWTEGKAMMSTIATAIRAYAAEKGPNGALPTAIVGTGATELGFMASDLTGIYFQDSDFNMAVTSLNPLTFTISCTSTMPNAPANPKTVTLDQAGNWTPKVL
jgi:hypothetical protein